MASTLVIVTVLVFDLIAFGLAVAAEQRRSTAQTVSDSEKNYTYCVYDSDIATGSTPSRLTFIIAEACLLAGSVRNAYHTRYRTLFVNGPPSCQTLRKGVFGAGAAFVFFTAILSEFYYVSYAKAKEGGVPTYSAQPSVGMSAYR